MMRNKIFSSIIIITAIAISGIIITQFFWVKDAIKLKNEQFYQNATLGLKRVVNQLMSLQNDTSIASKFMVTRDGESIHTQFIQSLDHNLVEEMINTEFRNLEVCKVFHYGIYNKDTKVFIMISDELYSEQILNSIHKAPISCIFQEDQFVLAVFFPLERQYVFSKMWVYIFLSILFLMIVVSGFWYVTSSLLKQKKLSEMKTDFVNNMTHELKTPISTISITSELLMKEEVQRKPDKIKRYAEIIFNENRRLKRQVDQVLRVAILDRGKFKLTLEEIDVHEIIHLAADRFLITVSQRDGVIHNRLNAATSIIHADRAHFSNVLNNLLDNANKYSPEKPEITISTHSNKKGIFITIDDHGIGMAQEHLSQIFKKFHRISTGDIHDVKGFGIGLYYVKTMIEAHSGSISVKSVLGKGSSFTVFLPFKKIRSSGFNGSLE